jgi:hypothetical protein
MSWCLIPKIADKFKEDIISGKIDPFSLAQMTSADRRVYFADKLGKENAERVNTLFESKLLIKNRQLGMIAWAKQMLGDKPDVFRDAISTISRMEKILKPEDEAMFLEDLASKKLGTHITMTEAKVLTEMSTRLESARVKVSPTEPNGSPNRLEYGAAKVAMQNYVNDLKISNKTIDWNPVSIASNLAGVAKGIRASLDDSAVFRQGWKTLFTNPALWAKSAIKTFGDIATQITRKPGDNRVLDGIKAEIYSRQNAIDNHYRKMKLDIGESEEAFPTPLPEKIPLFGRFYKASEVAYTGFLYRLRADIADKVLELAKIQDVNLKDELQIRSIGKLVNSLTGRGDLGPFEKVGKQVNTILFSPKMLKSTLDFLTIHATDKMSAFARKQAAKNLLKVVMGTGTLLAIANALMPGSVETDPRSADFGKIRVGDTRFDVSGGMASMVVLASRLMSQSTKSSNTGKVTKINSGEFGSMTGQDVLVNFMMNKLSPAAQVVKNLLNQSDFQGNQLTAPGMAKDLFVPLPISNATETLKNPNSAPFLLTIIADALGIVTNTYSPKPNKTKNFLKPSNNFLK